MKKVTPQQNPVRTSNFDLRTSSFQPPSTFHLLVMGASLGGIEALRVIFSHLNPAFPAPVAVALHRGEESDDTLCTILQQNAALPVSDAEDKMSLSPGCVYLAPPRYHLLVEPGLFALSIDEPVINSRPSIDVLFESAADAYRETVIAVLLTGNNRDGAEGLRRIQEYGGLAVIQDPSDAEGKIMPRAGMATVPDAKVLPLEEIAGFLNKVFGEEEGRTKDEGRLTKDD